MAAGQLVPSFPARGESAENISSRARDVCFLELRFKRKDGIAVAVQINVERGFRFY
jgi:hypothetical protein